MIEQDTIVALATPPGKGGVAVIRVSGPHALSIAASICQLSQGAQLEPRYAYFKKFFDEKNQIIDEGLVLSFPGPQSFTGENVVELQGHGGPYVIQQLLDRCCVLGARIANPGEFSLRAFLNDKIDLAQAEAIADLIDAKSLQAAQSAMASLQGEFSNQVGQVAQSLLKIRMYVEAAMDFPEDDIDFLADTQLHGQCQSLLSDLHALLNASKQGVRLRDGFAIAILGAPNAGKSSLLNQLSQEDTAIVTPIAGTTRDVLKCDITLAGYPLQIIDTAGLRATADLVEQEGIRRAKLAAGQADHIFFLIEAQHVLEQASLETDLMASLKLKMSQVTIIVNKVDTLTAEQQQQLHQLLSEKTPRDSAIVLSAKTGEGLSHLGQRIEQLAGGRADESPFTARRRHLMALQQAYDACAQGFLQLQSSGSGELLAEDLKVGHRYLGEITGKISSDDLLGHIFSSFCIGK